MRRCRSKTLTYLTPDISEEREEERTPRFRLSFDSSPSSFGGSPSLDLKGGGVRRARSESLGSPMMAHIAESVQLFDKKPSPSLSASKKEVSDAHSGTTSLHQLFKQDTRPSLEMLRIASSTNPIELRLRDTDGRLPLHASVDRDDPSPTIVRELLKLYPGAARVKDSMGNLPLFLACRRKRVQIGVIRALLKAYPEAAKVKIMGALALHHLLHTGSPSAESAQLLIDANPDGPRTSNAFGNLPLHYLCALSAPHIKTIRVVMAAYPKAVQTKNKRGETPISRALAGCAKDAEDAETFKRQIRGRSNTISSSSSGTTTSGSGSGSDEESDCGVDQELDEYTDPALRRERVRLLLRICDKSELSQDQLQLLRELNYEAHRTALLCFVSLCRKYDTSSLVHPATTVCEPREKESKDEDKERGKASGTSLEFRRAICSGDIWRNITSYT